MPKESFLQIQSNTDEITNLKQAGGKFIGTGFDTYTELNAYKIPEEVHVNDFTFVRQDETKQNATTRYIVVEENGAKKFQFAYIINESTYGNFKKGVAGLIVGADEEGKVFAENDGTASVKGWDSLKSSVNDAISRITEIENNPAGKIDSIKRNNVELEIVDRSVNILVPTKTSELTNDSNYVIKSTLDTQLAKYLPLTGGTLTGDLTLPKLILGQYKGVSLEVQGDSADTEDLVIRTANGQGTLVIDYSSKTVRPDLALTNQLNLGTSSAKWKAVYATSFIGALTGNADTATKLKTGKTIQTNLSSNEAKSFDGSANITPRSYWDITSF